MCSPLDAFVTEKLFNRRVAIDLSTLFNLSISSKCSRGGIKVLPFIFLPFVMHRALSFLPASLSQTLKKVTITTATTQPPAVAIQKPPSSSPSSPMQLQLPLSRVTRLRHPKMYCNLGPIVLSHTCSSCFGGHWAKLGTQSQMQLQLLLLPAPSLCLPLRHLFV